MRSARSAEASELSTDARLLTLALARMNDSGHAVFQRLRGNQYGELQHLLGTVDLKAGVRVPVSRETVYRLKKKLARAGFLSGARRCAEDRS